MQTDFDIPKSVAICPVCGGALSLEVNEWESETGHPTEPGCYVDCDKHCTLDYGTGVALVHRVWLWTSVHVVVRETREMLLQKMADFQAGKPLPGGMGL
jgi:hypothetical protein